MINKLIAFYIIAFIFIIPSALKLFAGVFEIRLENKFNIREKTKFPKFLLNL